MASGTARVSAADVRHDWFVVDASGLVLGRLATRVARILSGKHRANYVPYLDMGDFVVVTNAEKIKLTGTQARREDVPPPHRVPGRIEVGAARASSRRSIPSGSSRTPSAECCRSRSMGRKQMKKLKVYRGAKHPHEAQQPRPLKVSA